MEGLIVRTWRGKGGKIVVPGLGAVLGMIEDWTLVRHEETRQGALMWTLRGALSYVNETMVAQESLPLRVTLTTYQKSYDCEFERENLSITGNQITIKEVTLNAR